MHVCLFFSSGSSICAHAHQPQLSLCTPFLKTRENVIKKCRMSSARCPFPSPRLLPLPRATPTRARACATCTTPEPAVCCGASPARVVRVKRRSKRRCSAALSAFAVVLCCLGRALRRRLFRQLRVTPAGHAGELQQQTVALMHLLGRTEHGSCGQEQYCSRVTPPPPSPLA